MPKVTLAFLAVFAWDKAYSRNIFHLPLATQILNQNMYTLSRNGFTVPNVQMDSHSFLLNYPRGAYTTARTVNQKSVFEFETHVKRTASSFQEIFHSLQNSALVQEFGKEENLRERMAASMSTAICDFYSNFPEHEERELKLTVLATVQSSDVPEYGAELVPELYCHACLLPDIPSRPIKVEIRGQPRENALAKDSQWVRDRKSLQNLVAPDANEMILRDEDGFLYEGGQTNFYAIIDGVVYTAGEGVLEGTVRRLLLEVCEKNTIPVVLEPPNIRGIESWEGALISSTSRLALPIDEISLPQDGCCVCEQDQKIYFSKDNLLAEKISALIKQEVQSHSTQII